MSQPIPATMHAVQLDEPNGQLTLREIPVPRPRPGQVLVRMAAAPINPSDLGTLSGSGYYGALKFPFTPGVEGSGTVVAAGAGWLPRLLVGRRVACSAPLPGNGTWAEYMVTAAQLCVPLNKQVSLEQGAMLLVNPLSALAIFEMAARGHHRALVSTAAASALGGMLVRVAKRRNLPVIHIVRRPAQVDAVRAQGGEHVLNSSDADFADRLQALARQLHATLWLDAIGGQMTQQLAEAAPYGSRLLLYSRLAGEPCVIDPLTALTKNLHFDGWFLPNWIREKNLLQVLRTSQQAQSLLGSDLHSAVHSRLPLSAAQQAVAGYIQNMTAGKVLLVADSEALSS
jgi:NADPH:quinone reductase